MKLRVIVMSLLLFLFSVVAQALEYSSSGFYWPLRDDTPNFSSCGRWLERGSPNGCYPQDPSKPKVYHTGSDMSAGVNTPAYAIADGIVKTPSSSGWSGSTTNEAVIIEHKLADGRTFRALYGHLKSSSTVKSGSQVTAGQKIGEVGDWSGGDHIHFGILSPGLTTSVSGGDYLGRWLDSNYGIKSNSDGYYDNGFIDPIWFITHNAPDNWISKGNVNPNTLTYPINTMNPWFVTLCGNSYDSRCDGSDVTAFTECVVEGSTLCAPPINNYSAVNGGGFHSSGGSGGDSGSLPDFIINKIWLEDSTGNTRTIFEPGQAIRMKSQAKNVGADSPSDIQMKFYLSNGTERDSNAPSVASDTLLKGSMTSGGTNTKTETLTAPMQLGTYNITTCVDTQHVVAEEHESNNCSDEAVFSVIPTGAVMSILNDLMLN